MSHHILKPIIWRSEDKQITLIDIPHVILYAQGTHDRPCRDLLYSTQAQEEPYHTNEPKSAAARSKLVGNTVDKELHDLYAKLLCDATSEIKAAHDGAWCLPRYLHERPVGKGLKRKLEPEETRELSETKKSVTSAHWSKSQHDGVAGGDLSNLSRQTFTMIHGLDSSEGDGLYQYHSASDGGTRAGISVNIPGAPQSPCSFYIPPESSFVLGPCSDSRTLHQHIRAQAQELETPKQFDFILLDPPWPNSSVKRTHKTAHSTYSTARSLDDIHQLITGMDLDMLMADSCLVAVWITNKPAVRDLVLGEGGLFDCWGVEAVEEWVWLKTTVHGEPVTPIDSVWRKPYEILLLGRKRRNYAAVLPAEAATHHNKLTRRVLVSVPDLHSRKPCLKQLIEELVPDPASYRALEVFARHLVAGWWSWGDECIKFNAKEYWQREASATTPEICDT